VSTKITPKPCIICKAQPVFNAVHIPGSAICAGYIAVCSCSEETHNTSHLSWKGSLAAVRPAVLGRIAKSYRPATQTDSNISVYFPELNFYKLFNKRTDTEKVCKSFTITQAISAWNKLNTDPDAIHVNLRQEYPRNVLPVICKFCGMNIFMKKDIGSKIWRSYEEKERKFSTTSHKILVRHRCKNYIKLYEKEGIDTLITKPLA